MSAAAALYRRRREAAVASWTNDSSAVLLLRPARGLRSWDLSRGAAPLTRGQTRERVDQFGTRLQPDEQITSRSVDGRCHPVKLAAAPGAATAIVERQVDEDPSGIRPGLRHPSHAWPPPRNLEQALLHEILGLARIPRDQVGSLRQLLEVAGDKLVENRPSPHITPSGP